MLKIKKLIAENVNGYIPLKLKFNNDITFLTGSNGCGKTSALKLISALLQPNFELINDIKFDFVQLVCWNKNEEIIISITKKKDSQNAEWSISKEERTKNETEPDIIGGELKLYPELTDFQYLTDEIKNLKESVRSQFYDSDFFSLIDSLGNPVLLGIDRKIVGKVYDKRTLRRRSLRYHNKEVSNVSFQHAQNAVIDYVSSNADLKRTLVETLKANIFLTLFKYVSFKNINDGYEHISEGELQKKKDLTISAVKRLDLGDDILNEIEKYFLNIKALQEKMGDDNVEANEKQITLNEWWANRPHLARIELVSEYAEVYQKEIDELDFPLIEITKIANSFFDESNKTLRIGANGWIHVDWTNKNITTSNLSSGENQLIVIIIHLVFCELEKDQSLFVIDEPELSLHLSWQEKFVDAIIQASPGTQFILATHSPAIISRLEFEKKCIVMKNA